LYPVLKSMRSISIWEGYSTMKICFSSKYNN
jgi:hypothetical protein